MSSCVEFEGKAVDKAVQKASEKLNIPVDKLKYKVVSHGSSGIFGLVGVKKAKISVTIPSKPEARIDKEVPENDFGEKESSIPGDSVIDSYKEVDESVSSIIKETFDETPEQNDPVQNDREPVSFPQEAIDSGREALQRIIDFITTGASITISEGEDRLLYNVRGGNAGVLIGKRGKTLEAIQYLVEKIINKKSKERIRIQIDVEDYLDNRRANLESLASRLAEKTKKTGKPSTIGQMNAHDRRIIHLSLKDNPEVRTQSIGDGFYRKLVIFPKRKNYRRKKNNI